MTSKQNTVPKRKSSTYRPKQFSRSDCEKLIEIYLRNRKTKVSWYLIQTEADPISLIQRDLNIALARYDILKSRARAPTAKQLKDKHRIVGNSAKKLFGHLKESTDYHFMAALVAAKAGKVSPVFLDDEKFREVYFGLQSLGESLKWLMDGLQLCLKEGFVYEDAKPDKQLPETALIKFLSDVLTKYFENKGHGRGDRATEKAAMGWRIDCLEHLLNCAGVSKTKAQIIDSIA